MYKQESLYEEKKSGFRHHSFDVFKICLAVLVFSSCSNPSINNPDGTWVQFNNLEQFSVVIYRDPSRQTVFVELKANETRKIEAAPAPEGIAFYPTFIIDVPGIPGVTIPYNGPAIITAINENETTRVPIPKLESIDISAVYLLLANESDFSLSLQYGNAELTPLGGRSSIITPGNSAAYEISSGPSSDYSVMRNTIIPLDFSADVGVFEPGRVYSFMYDGTNIALSTIWPIPSLTLPTTPAPAWPSAPVNIRVQAISINMVQLAWDSIQDAESYRIYRATGSGSAPYTQITTTVNCDYLDTGLARNESYYYKISAIKNGLEGEQSNAMSVVLIDPPANVRTVGVGDTFVWLRWNAVNGATGYYIYRSDSQNGTYTRVSSSFTQDNSSVANLAPLTTYYFRISVIINSSESILSNPFAVSTASPIDFRVTFTTSATVDLEWNTISAARYQILRSDSRYGTFSIISNNLTNDSYTDIGVSPNSTYYYNIGITFFDGSSNSYTFQSSDRVISAYTGN